MKFGEEDLLVNIFKCLEEIFDIFCPSEDMASFLKLKLHGKLEHSWSTPRTNFGCVKKGTSDSRLSLCNKDHRSQRDY